MDANHGADDQPDDDVFGPVEDGEEVFEWIDDADDESGVPADKPPTPTFRERMAQARAGASRLRRSRRRVGAAAAVVVLAVGLGGGFTAWFDNVAGAADRAGEIALAVDSVVDGDPAAAKYDSVKTSATGDYVVEIANNSPEAVTVTSVGLDGGSRMSSTGWRPVGASARIAGGGTGKVVLNVRMFCPMVMGAYNISARDGVLSIPFPALNIRVRGADGDDRDLVLPTRTTVGSQGGSQGGGLTFLQSDGQATPQVVSADAGACTQWLTDRMDQLRQQPTDIQIRPRTGVMFDYDKLVSPAANSTFTLGFHVRNTSDHPLTVATRNNPDFPDDSRTHTDWQPSRLQLAPGQSLSAQLTVHINDCGGSSSGPPILGLTSLEVDDPRNNSTLPVYLDQAMTGSLRLASDLAQQMKVVCP